MADVAAFCFNDFLENTYVVYNESGECLIFDPGCSTTDEQQQLVDFIDSRQLRPIALINTHCHIDHVLGNAFVAKKYGLSPQMHKGEELVLDVCPQIAVMYGINYTSSPKPKRFIIDGEFCTFGSLQCKALFTPGHSPASLCFHFGDSGFVIGGDVLFKGSIGRTDLPGGDLQTLMSSIKHKLLALPPETIVYPGHGEPTTIGEEDAANPFIRAYIYDEQ